VPQGPLHVVCLEYQMLVWKKILLRHRQVHLELSLEVSGYLRMEILILLVQTVSLLDHVLLARPSLDQV
jgi:hypothetical protein